MKKTMEVKMKNERLGGGYNDNEAGKPDWKMERERDLAVKKKIGRNALGAVLAATIISTALAGCSSTKELMGDKERSKNVKKIEVEGITFYDGVNARREPFVDNNDPNVLASIGEDGMQVVVDYDGDGYYYNNENDKNGGWYGFEAEQLSDELLENSYISRTEANNLKSDKKYGDGTVWFNEKYVSIEEANTAS